MTLTTVLALSALGLPCDAAAQPAVSGTATYRERIALPPNAVFEATLEDISLADAPAKVLGRLRIESPGQVPIAFEVPYDATAIDPRHSYSVRARILVEDRLLFTTDTVHPVLTRGHGNEVEMLMVRASGSRPAPARPAPLGELPATFFGETPCASCPGIRTTFTLRPDGIFLERRVYLEADNGTDATAYDHGRWSLSDDARALTLRGGPGSPRQFAVQGPDSLRMLDTLGRPIDSPLSYDLTRVETDPIADTMRWRGLYTYMADAARFGDCRTGLQRPVAFEKDSLSLERAYLAARTEPGAPLLVIFDGRLTERPAMEGDALEEAFVVDAFDSVRPEESCEPSRPDVSLMNTHWRLVELDGAAVSVVPGQREAHIRLQSGEGRVVGSGGCNRLTGAYSLDGTRLAFETLAMTRMACPAGMETERAFAEALEATTGYLVTGESMQLRDDEGSVRARLEAVYFE